ncbi:MAG: pilus assembly protein TadG-related protein [Nocardioides sp.]|uniref:pilus assembly protein TadG-related protein n=1 Tax=Nocardioides sp. TaxID=35761 RepID=UPI0039E71C78
MTIYSTPNHSTPGHPTAGWAVRLVDRLRHRANEAGYAAILMALLTAAVLFPISALAVDVSRMYVEGERLQAAADAAAMAGVTYLPDDFDAAEAEALRVSATNGFPNGGHAFGRDSGGTVTVLVQQGAKPTQLQVTVSSQIHNEIATMWGDDTATITRTAVADYNGPAPMGSPCNTFGNEPAGSSSDSSKGPAGSVLSVPEGGAVCSTNPQMWAAIAGPNTAKGNGDQYMTRKCGSSSDSGCTGTTNDEFDPQGYFFTVSVRAAAVGSPITIQLYDPAWVENGDTCGSAPTVATGASLVNSMNNYTTTDGITRYAMAANNFCTGDVSNGAALPATSFALLNPTDTYDPKRSTVYSSGCIKQYPGYAKDKVTTATLTKGNTKYDDNLARVYHQWVTMCTFTPTTVGDYYLQVRTNVALGGSSDGDGGYVGNTKVHSQTDDDTSVGGNGNNRFSIRLKGAPTASVSVAGWQHMSIYANYSGASSTFNLVRVIPAAATKTLVIGFFDVGDASGSGTIRVLPPSDSNLTALPDCVGSGVVNGTLTNCQLSGVSSSSGWNAKSQYIRIPIPATYTCQSSKPGGCWFRLQVSFPSSVNDTTTWTAQITGDPIRLIE